MGTSSRDGESLRLAEVIPEGYAERPPPPDLANHVECIWTRRVSAPRTDPGRMYRVLPDGCVDLIFGFEIGNGGGPGEIAHAMGVGAMTRPLAINDGLLPSLYIGVRFLPGRALAALGRPAAELTDERIAYEGLARGARAELDALASQSTHSGRVDAVIELVRRRVVRAAAVPASVRAAVARISIARGNLRVADLAGEIGVTRQALARQFATHVGVPPKMFARVMRARAALVRADAAREAYPRGIDWSAIAYELGYFDQPHFIDDFKAITGLTPSRWS